VACGQEAGEWRADREKRGGCEQTARGRGAAPAPRRVEYPKDMQKPMEDLFDAFLYLGPQDLRLKEPLPADIALDMDDRMELQRRKALSRSPGPATEDTLKESDRETVRSADNPLLVVPKGDIKSWMGSALQTCLDRKNRGTAPQGQLAKHPP
jgi:hypothetical protein